MTILGNTLIFDRTDIELINDCYNEIHKIISIGDVNSIYSFLYEYNRQIKKSKTRFNIKFIDMEITVIPLSRRRVILECSDKMLNMNIDMEGVTLFSRKYMKRTIVIYLYKLLKIG